MSSIVPVIDMALRKKDRAAFACQLGEAFETIGFARLTNHPVSLDLIQRAREVSAELFAHTDEVLKQWEDVAGGRQTGFTPFQTEGARDAAARNLMRFWHIRSQRQCEDRGYPVMLPDTLVPAFGPTMLELFGMQEALGLDLLSDLDLYLGHEGTRLRDMAVGGDTVLRNIHYPSVENLGAGGAVRSAPHEDINLITLLLAATQPGLMVKDQDGNIHSVNEERREIVVDGGDMLQLATGGWLDENWTLHGGRFRATTHWVRNPERDEADVPRNSMPTFIHPRPDAVLWDCHMVRQIHYLTRRLWEIRIAGPELFEAALQRFPITPWY